MVQSCQLNLKYGQGAELEEAEDLMVLRSGPDQSSSSGGGVGGGCGPHGGQGFDKSMFENIVINRKNLAVCTV